MRVVKETTITAEKKPVVLALPYLGSISLKTRSSILHCCKFQIAFKNKTRLGNNFHLKGRIFKDLTSGAVYKCQCET